MRIILTLLCVIVSIMAYAQTTDTNIKYRIDGIGTAAGDGKGIWFANTTNAALGAQQYSPSMVLEGQGWATAGSSQSVKFMEDVVPVQGTSNPSGTWRLRSSINGGAYSATPIVQANSDGTVLIGGPTITSNTRLDVRGTANTTELAVRIANLANTSRWQITNQGHVTQTTQLGGHSMNATYTAFSDNLSVYALNGTVDMRSNSGDIFTQEFNQGGIRTNGTNQTLRGYASTGTWTVNHTGATILGYDYNPTIAGSQTPTHLAWRNTSGSMLIGGPTLSSASALVDMQSLDKGLVVPRVTNIASITSPVSGMMAYDAATDQFKFRQGPTWVTLGGGGGITNSAANNEMMKSDGTNAVPSGVFSTVSGDLTLGSAASSGDRVLSAQGSTSNISLQLKSKGNGNVALHANFTGTILGFASQFQMTDNTNSVTLSPTTLYFTRPVTSGTNAIAGANGTINSLHGSNMAIGGGSAYLTGNNNGGNVLLAGGQANGTGTAGSIVLQPGAGHIRVQETSTTTPSMGVATLVGGTVTISSSKITANTRIFLTHQNASGTVGVPYISARTAGTSFTITSSSGSDTSTIAWVMIEPN